MVEIPTLRQLLEAGAHFGHKKERSYPKSRPYVYVLKDQIYVINLEKTRDALQNVMKYLQELSKEGKTVLFVGTKMQARDLVAKTAENVDMPYIIQRWLGGMLTNFETVRRRIKNMDELDEKLKSDEAERFTKKERAKWQEEADKLHRVFDGIKTMRQLPDALFVIDVVKEKIAVTEARKMNIPIIGIVDTNANPELIDYPIPANDDAAKTISLILNLAEQAIKEGKNKQKFVVKENPPEGGKDEKK